MKPLNCLALASLIVAATAPWLRAEHPMADNAAFDRGPILFDESVVPAQLRSDISAIDQDDPPQLGIDTDDATGSQLSGTSDLRHELEWADVFSQVEGLPSTPARKSANVPQRDPQTGPGFQSEFQWQATNLAHRRLFFEDPALERYGLGAGPVVQPIVSGCRFVVDTVKTALRGRGCRAGQLEYTLGYPRPGSEIPCAR